ncbi:unnamed protein product [Periconia digitata]|uniref:Ankyrin n=1 Tax=Periconia digitata TaxID=1303443 RepID=A0A9W4XNQ8_9PLEO|nr:unnamed protein product [Periconia digitata]
MSYPAGPPPLPTPAPPSPQTQQLRATLKLHIEAGAFESFLTALETPHKLQKSEIQQRVKGAANRAILIAIEKDDCARVRDIVSQWKESAVEPEDSDTKIDEEALVVAVQRRHGEIAALLVESGAMVGKDVLRAMLDGFADADADYKEMEELLERLVKAGWDVNAQVKCPMNTYALQLAVRAASSAGNTRFLDWLLEHGASPDISVVHWTGFSKGADTAFAWTKRQASPWTTFIRELAPISCIRKLLNHGAKPDNNVLHAAIRLPRENDDRMLIIQLMLARGADVNALETDILWVSNGSRVTITHATPLYEAVIQDDLAVMKLLVEHGANARVRNSIRQWSSVKPGMNALDAMRRSTNEEMRALADERWGKETRAQQKERKDLLGALEPRKAFPVKSKRRRL